MGLKRRHFLRLSGISLLAAACAPAPRAARQWAGETPGAGRDPASPSAAAVFADDDRGPLLVTVFLRGAADGLHLVPPTGDRGYPKLRGPLALSETLPFTREFSLHPELASLSPLIQRGQLAAVHAVGSPHATRSHFEAQDIMELGDLGPARDSEGWLTRALVDRDEANAFSSLALASAQPVSLRGSGAFAIDDPQRFGLPGTSRDAREQLEARYAEGGDALSDAGARALRALGDYERAMGGARSAGVRQRGRQGRNTLTAHAQQLLDIDRSGLAVRAACLETGGWDTHVNQGGERGPLAERIRDLGEGVAQLADGLGQQRDWLLVVMTEFGRTVRGNGSRGTDHGHGAVMLVAGPRVRGGVYGDWAGLSEDRLYEGRDLPVLTDWRSVLHEVLRAHLAEKPPADTFPSFTPEALGIVSQG